MRDNQEKEKVRSQSKPGNGNCWKKGITISEEFNLSCEKTRGPSIGKLEIKSLSKPLMLSKYNNVIQSQNNEGLNTRSYRDVELSKYTLPNEKKINNNVS